MPPKTLSYGNTMITESSRENWKTARRICMRTMW